MMMASVLIQLAVVVLSSVLIKAQYGQVLQPTYQRPQVVAVQPVYQPVQQQCAPRYVTQTQYVTTAQVQYQTQYQTQYVTQTQTVPQYITQVQTQTVAQYVTQTQVSTVNVPQYITQYQTVPQYFTDTLTVPQYITSTAVQYNTITQTVPSYFTQTVSAIACKQQRPTGYGSNAGGAALNFVSGASGGANYGNNQAVPANNNFVGGYGK